MATLRSRCLAALVAALPVALLAACRGDTPAAPASGGSPPALSSFARSEWTAPENLGGVVNSAANEQAPTISPDGLSLYFLSNREGGHGGNDIWISRRDCDGCPWRTPENAGPLINTSFNEGGPGFSGDGHLLFFVSNQPVASGPAMGADIFMTSRMNPHDDAGWTAPIRLGAGVNTPDQEAGPEFLANGEEGAGTIYFNRGVLQTFSSDIYVAAISRDGSVRRPAVLVAELSAPNANDANPSVRADGREVFFWSFGREGSVGGGDAYTSTRQSVHAPWSEPVKLPAPISTDAGDIGAELSSNGRTLLIVSNRAGGFGGFDLWISTRTPSGR